MQVAAGEGDDDVSLAVRRSRDGHGARSRRARLPHAALPHARRHAARRVDARDLHVRALRKPRVRLEHRPDARQLVGIADDDRVRVADVDRDHLVSRDALGRRHLHLSDVLLDPPVRQPPRDDLALADADASCAAPPSHAAAIRVALPDSSAVDPSGFQMTTSAQSSPRADDLRRCRRRHRRRGARARRRAAPPSRDRRCRARPSAPSSELVHVEAAAGIRLVRERRRVARLDEAALLVKARRARIVALDREADARCAAASRAQCSTDSTSSRAAPVPRSSGATHIATRNTVAGSSATKQLTSPSNRPSRS